MLKSLARRTLDRLGYQITRNGHCDVFDAFIRRLQRPGFTFVQIGANDGKRFDPIHRYVNKYGWRGLAIEPVQEYFDELCRTYASQSDVTCCRCAVYETETPVTLYRVDPKSADMPEWSKGIASLLPDHHEKSNTPKSCMIEETAPGVPLTTLLRRHGISSMDLLQIDAEGYDYNIVKMIPFDTSAPRLVRFEHSVQQNVMSPDQLAELVSLLVRHGYDVHVAEHDCFAMLR